MKIGSKHLSIVQELITARHGCDATISLKESSGELEILYSSSYPLRTLRQAYEGRDHSKRYSPLLWVKIEILTLNKDLLFRVS